MKYSVLTIVQKAASELGLTPPSTIVASTDANALQLKALIGAVCDELARDYSWSFLHTEYSFPTVYDTTVYPLPPDFLRIVNSTEWNHTNGQPLTGPVTASGWQHLKNSSVGATQYTFRLKGPNVVITPTPGIESSTLSLEYISGYYVIDSTTYIPKTDIDSNSDLLAFDDRLVINGIKLKFKELNGLNTESAAYDFETTIANLRNADAGAPVLVMGRPNTKYSMYANFPDGNWNQ
jgi:hypothetical protein